MTSYNIHQQIWVLCASSGIATASVGTQADLQELMSTHLQPTIDTMEIGNWKVVWGPNVWKANPDDTSAAADHTWYVAHNPSAVFEAGNPYDTYVVSITGTATNSQVDADEDNQIGQVVDFNAWSQLGFESTPLPASQVDQAKPYIALGTANGVHWLLSIPTKDGTTLLQFLSTVPSASRIVFTGHSLGGALSPTVAMAVTKVGTVNVPLANIFTYPVAGPSPGNGPFAALYAKTFPQVASGGAVYQVWNTVIWNGYDIVPHAWNRDTVKGQSLSDIPSIYGELPFGLGVLVGAGVLAAQVTSQSAPVYIPLQETRVLPKVKPVTPQTWDAFTTTAGYQHVYGYYDVIGTPLVPSLGDAPDSKKALSKAPVFSCFERAKAEKA